MGVNQDRTEAVYLLLLNDKKDRVDAEFVQGYLRCGRGQARRAIQKARLRLAEEGKRVSYATASNGYKVRVDGDADERARSYVTRMQSIITQRINAGIVMAPSADHGKSTKEERFLGQHALADQRQAEADRIRLEAIKELLS